MLPAPNLETDMTQLALPMVDRDFQWMLEGPEGAKPVIIVASRATSQKTVISLVLVVFNSFVTWSLSLMKKRSKNLGRGFKRVRR